MNNELFSVAISVYQYDVPVYFDRALSSITDSQTIKPDEIVLVVDGPVSSEIDGVITKYQSKYNLKVLRLETNLGLGNALKLATENCSNNLIARMDADDVAVPTRFEQQLKIFNENKNTDIVGGNVSEFVDKEDNIISYRSLPTNDTDIKSFMKKRCPFNHMTVMFKKNSLFKAGGYLDWHYNEDYYLWIRMALSGCVFCNTGTVLVNVRTGKNLFARRGGWKYYKSERGIQKYMLKSHIITFPTYFVNCFKRFIVEILLPGKARAFLYKKLARSQNETN